MKLTFELQPEDHVAFYKFHYWYSPERKGCRLRQRAIYGLGFFSLPFVFTFWSEEIALSKPILLNLAFFAFIVGGICIQYSKEIYFYRLNKWAIKANKEVKSVDVYGTTTLEFRSDQMVWNTLNFEGKANYSLLEKLMQDQSYFYLYLTTGDAWVIPKYTVGNSEEQIRFEVMIRSKMN